MIERIKMPFLHDLSPSASALTGSDNKRVSGYGASHLRPNPSLTLRTSDTRKTLYDMAGEVRLKEV